MTSLEADVFAQHVLEAGFLWILRDQATRDAAYDLDRLTELDERLEANLDGLRLAGESGWELALQAVERGEPGEVFTAATLATWRGDLEGLARVLDMIAGEPARARGLVSGLGWSEIERVRELLPGMLDVSCPPELHWLGIAACSAHREDPGAYLGLAVGSDDPRVRARAILAAGELGRMDVLPALTVELQSPDESIRFSAAYAGTLLRSLAAADALVAFAHGDGARAEDAADMLARALDPRDALAKIQLLTRSASTTRAAIRAAMALGDPALVPWLLDCAANDDFARPAAWALSTMLGVDLVDLGARVAPKRDHAAGPNDDPEDSNVAMDPDESLEWPDARILAKVWERERSRFQRGTRYLLGKEATAEQLGRALREAVQPVRRGAALDIALRSSGGRPVFQTSAPGLRQQRLLA